jgi:hypothetical protein
MHYARWSTVLPDGKRESGFFALNFTLAELRTLYAKQAIPGRDQTSKHSYKCDCCVPSASLSSQPQMHSSVATACGYLGMCCDSEAGKCSN